jgi:Protein of unknown function (DUF3108)
VTGVRGVRAPFVVALVLSCALHAWLIERLALRHERRPASPPRALDVTLAPIARPPVSVARRPDAPPDIARERPAGTRAIAPPTPVVRPAPPPPRTDVSPPQASAVPSSAPPDPAVRVRDGPPDVPTPEPASRAGAAEARPREPAAAPALQDEAEAPRAPTPPPQASSRGDLPLQDEAAAPRAVAGPDRDPRPTGTRLGPDAQRTASLAPPEPSPSPVPDAPAPGTPTPTPTAPVPTVASPAPATPAAPARSPAPSQAPSAAPAAPAATPAPSVAPSGSPSLPSSAAAGPPAPTPLPGGFPARASLEYVMRIGETGAVIGRPRIEWEFADGQYRVQSVTKLVGVARVVPNDTWRLKSEGTYSAQGLRPRRFEISGRLGGGAIEAVDIDWERYRIAFTPGGRVLPVAEGTQDLLSFMFQFALRPPEAGGATVYVTNARKLDLYRYEWVDEEVLSLPIGRLRGEHIERLHNAGESSQELWIAPERFNLPLRVRFTFRAGLTIEMQAVRLDVRQ